MTSTYYRTSPLELTRRVYSICRSPSGWARQIQPEGQPYYVKVLHGRTYITETDIMKPENWSRMQIHINDMESRISAHANGLPEVFQIFLQPLSDSLATYYMVNHDRDHRCLFWIDELDILHYYRAVDGLHTLAHWRACFHSQFSVCFDSKYRAQYA